MVLPECKNGRSGFPRGRFAGCREAVRGKNFNFFQVDGQCVVEKIPEKAKKYFGGLENGCIFAPAFDGTGLRPAGKRKDIETLGSGDSVCLWFGLGAGSGTRNESKVDKSNSYNEEFDPGSG